MIKRLKNRLIKYLFNAVIVEDIISCRSNKTVFINGKKISEGELNKLRSEANQIRDMRLYKLLYSTMIDKAQKNIFENSRTIDDIFAGKMMIMSLDTQKKIIDKLSEY